MNIIALSKAVAKTMLIFGLCFGFIYVLKNFGSYVALILIVTSVLLLFAGITAVFYDQYNRK